MRAPRACVRHCKCDVLGLGRDVRGRPAQSGGRGLACGLPGRGEGFGLVCPCLQGAVLRRSHFDGHHPISPPWSHALPSLRL